ncbi:Alpha/Beta hydrolase protein [Nemania diffusa]|nr:Alpha/Beta hydrolase protein [Nemania diffusa]
MASSLRVVSPAPHHGSPHILPQQIYFRIPEFVLESGEVLLEAQVAFTFRGLLNAERDNAIVICHGLAENADVEDWWSPILQRMNPALDPQRFCIICCNSLGSPFGSSSPLTYRCDNRGKIGDELYALQFPRSTFRDDVQIHKRVMDILGVQSIFCVIGHGMGNITATEWVQLGQDYVRAVVLLETNGSHNSLMSFPGSGCWRFSDRDRATPTSEQRSSGTLKILYEEPEKPGDFDVECYMYMLDKINYFISGLENQEYGLKGLLAQIKQPTLVVGVSKQHRDKATGRELLNETLPSENFVLIEKEEGINGSLLEAEQLDALFHSFFHSISSCCWKLVGPESDTEG